MLEKLVGPGSVVDLNKGKILIPKILIKEKPIDVDKIAVVEFYALPLIGYIAYATQMGYNRL